MNPSDPRVTALATALVALIDSLTSAKPSESGVDALIPITSEALTPLQFEHRAVVRLVETGQLRTVQIGRRRYTKASWLAEMAEKLPISVPPPLPPEDELMLALRGRRKILVKRTGWEK